MFKIIRVLEKKWEIENLVNESIIVFVWRMKWVFVDVNEYD